MSASTAGGSNQTARRAGVLRPGVLIKPQLLMDVMVLEMWNHSLPLRLMGLVKELELVVGLLKQLLGYWHGVEVGELRRKGRMVVWVKMLSGGVDVRRRITQWPWWWRGD